MDQLILFSMDKKDWRRYLIFLTGGGLGALLNLAITYFLTEFLLLQYLISYAFGCLANIVFNFLFHQSITFQVYDNFSARFLKSVLASLGAAAGIITLAYFFTEYFGIWYLFSGALAIGIVSLANYFLHKNWVFYYDRGKSEK